MSNVVIAAPYWGQPGHLGCVRVDRFIRWLTGEGLTVDVVRAGSEERVESSPWGSEITVRDPIGFYRDLPEGAFEAIPLRRKSRLRRYLANLLLLPDPLVVWSRRAAHHRAVVEAASNADWVIASSPPESVHVLALRLSHSVGARLMVDLRDGWLDEPTIPMLPSSRVQVARHRRMEYNILRRADRIVVTSETWRRLLTERVPATAGKTAVLTNACPETLTSTEGRAPSGDDPNRPLTLLYAGKLQSSRRERRAGHLLQPIHIAVRETPSAGQLVFVGNLDDDERSDLLSWGERLQDTGWSVEVRPPVAREQARELIAEADGLLLLSSSMASIPAKLFDYIAARRPILAATRRGSEVWEIGNRVRQVSLVDIADQEPADAVCEFLAQCHVSDPQGDVPDEFTEGHLREVFLGLFAGATS